MTTVDRARRDGRNRVDDRPARDVRGAVAEAQSSPGQRLPTGLEQAMVPAFGPLDDVRVHVGPASARAAALLDARAFTVGREIHFATGAFQPATPGGLELLDHEVAHAVQPMSGLATAPLIARTESAAERDADHRSRGGRRAGAAREALVHRFPERGGLAEREVIPPPFLMQVFGARFLVALEIGMPSGTAQERDVKIAVQVQGTDQSDPIEITAGTVSGRELRIPATTARRAINASIVRLRETDVAIDLYGDGLTIIGFDIELRPDRFNASRDYHMTAGDLARGPRHGAIVRMILPQLGPNEVGAAGGTSASLTLSLGGDDIRFLARRFNRTAISISAEGVPGVFRPDAVALWVFDRVSPDAPTALAPSQRDGRDLWFDVDGDGRPDLRLVHSMAEWSDSGETGREHAFDAFDPQGIRIGARGRVLCADVPGRAPRPPIPPEQELRRGDATLSAWEPLETMLPSSPSTAGATPHPVTRRDSTIELRLDADGDRHQELMLLFRPRNECGTDGNQQVDIIFVQLSSHATATVTVGMSLDQAAALAPTIARATDGARATEIDLLRSAFDLNVTAPPLRLVLGPAFEQCGQRYHEVRVGDSAYTITLPCETERGQPLARDVSPVHEVGGVRLIDATLGEYSDRFRFVFDQVDSQDFLAIAGMSRRPDGTIVPGETRRIALAAGTGTRTPERIICNDQELRFLLGDRTVIIRDALTSPYHDDPAANRIHELTISGSAVPTERHIRFDVGPEGFWLGPDTVPTFDERLVRPVRSDDAIFEAVSDQGNSTIEMLRAALDADATTQEFYDAARSLHVAMLRLRVQVWASWNDRPADVPPVARAAQAAASAVLEAPGALLPGYFQALVLDLIAQNWGYASDSYPSNINGAFADYIHLLTAWEDRLRPRMQASTMDREAAAAAGALDTLIERSTPNATVAGLRLQYDAAIGAEVVTAHTNGLISDGLYNAWDRVRRNTPHLRLLGQTEIDTGTCEPDGGRIEQTIADANTIAGELETAGEAATDLADQLIAVSVTRAARAFGAAVVGHEWATAFAGYDTVMRGLDRWVSQKILQRYGAASDEYRRNEHLHHMRDELANLATHPDAIPIAATFAPDSEYHAVSGGITSIPLTVIVYRDGGEWHLRDLTPQRPYLASVSDNGEAEPPAALFAELNDNDRFPKGILYYQIPGGSGGRIRCTAEKDWYEWVRDFGLVLAAIGFVLATFGTGTVAVAGAYFLAGSAVANAIAAGGELHDTITSGQATTTSIVLNILDIIASLAGAGALISGTVVRSATTAARAGMAWTGAAARVAAFADRVYIPMTAVSTAGQVATVAVMTVDAHQQLEELGRSGASPEEIQSAREGLLIQLAITGGLTAMAVHGDLPEIRAGRRNIVLDVVGDIAVARAAGVQIRGVDIDLPRGSARAHAAARWHAEDIELGRVALGDDTDGFLDWHRRWLELPERVTFHPDGTYEINMPRGPNGEVPPASVQERLTNLAGPNSTIFHTERAFALADDIAAIERSGSGLRVDPLDADWPRTRRQLVDRLGDTPETEAMIRRFEQARRGALGGETEAYVQQRRHVNQVVPDHEVERISAMFPGQEVYIRGGLADTGATIGADVGRIEIEVVVPPGTSPDQMAAIEQRGDLLLVRPDPAFLQANGLPADRVMRVEVRVTTPEAFAGSALTGPPLLRIDNPLSTRNLELTAILERHLSVRGITDAPRFRVQVLSDEEFARQFGSEYRGRAVFRMEGDAPVIYARPNASPADMIDEASHLGQLRDADMARRIRQLDEINFHDWSAASAEHRLEMFQTKLEVEIDAKQRSLEALRAETPAPQADIDEVTRQLADLRTLQTEIAGITPTQLSQLNAGAIPMPSYLENPPWMFGRRSTIEGIRPNRFAVDPHAPRARVPTVGPERSSLSGQRGTTVDQIGSTWTERTLVFSDVEGTVTAITPADGGRTIVTVTRTESGATFTYRLERGATIDVEVGRPVSSGQRLGEDSRNYRLVEVTDASGRRTLREEIRRLPPEDGWIQRGSESTFRGSVMETAALTQLEVEATFRMSRGEISGTTRIPHHREGGGFDHVFVEFTGSGANTRARIRIVEVKDYPDRSVPLEEFTAIRGNGLEENLRILRTDAEAARLAAARGEPLPESFASLGLGADQIQAIAVATSPLSGMITVEVMVGPTTRIGAAGHHASTVIPSLRADVEAELGPGSFRTNAEGGPTVILRSYADEATAAATAARAGTGNGP